MKSSETDLVPTERWDGDGGLRSFSTKGRVAVPDPSRFQARWRHVDVEGVQVGEWTTSPIAGALPPARDALSVTLLVVEHGTLLFWVRDRQFHARAGSVHLISGDSPIRFSVPERSRLLRVAVPAAFLPQNRLGTPSGTAGAVAPSRLTAGLASIVEQVLDGSTGGPACPAARALRPLAIAAVEDALPPAPEPHLRARIVGFIERRLSDPELDPQSIADEFGISLRWAHHVFNVDGISLARHIRDRRLDFVAAQLQTDRRLPRVAALADRAGFSGRDQLARAFRARYGMTVAEYAALVSEGRAPESGDRQAP